jgi:hypothetical protein
MQTRRKGTGRVLVVGARGVNSKILLLSRIPVPLQVGSKSSWLQFVKFVIIRCRRPITNLKSQILTPKSPEEKNA